MGRQSTTRYIECLRSGEDESLHLYNNLVLGTASVATALHMLVALVHILGHVLHEAYTADLNIDRVLERQEQRRDCGEPPTGSNVDPPNFALGLGDCGCRFLSRLGLLHCLLVFRHYLCL